MRDGIFYILTTHIISALSNIVNIFTTKISKNLKKCDKKLAFTKKTNTIISEGMQKCFTKLC